MEYLFTIPVQNNIYSWVRRVPYFKLCILPKTITSMLRQKMQDMLIKNPKKQSVFYIS
jgi:hypothetical protein